MTTEADEIMESLTPELGVLLSQHGEMVPREQVARLMVRSVAIGFAAATGRIISKVEAKAALDKAKG